MRIVFYVFLNLYILLICGLGIYEEILKGNRFSFWNTLIAFIITAIVINLVVYMLEKVMNRISDYIFKKYEQHRMKKYSLFKWMGDSNWIQLYNILSEIKGIDPADFSKNYKRIKIEIKKEFKNIQELKDFHLHLEVKVDSPKLTSMINLTQSIIIGFMTALVTGIISWKIAFDIVLIGSSAGLFIVWFILINIIDFISRQISKYKLLLKLVTECIHENQAKGIN